MYKIYRYQIEEFNNGQKKKNKRTNNYKNVSTKQTYKTTDQVTRVIVAGFHTIIILTSVNWLWFFF